jgi:hypothetical protein
MTDIIFLLAGLLVLFTSFFVYTALLTKGKIKPHIPPRYLTRSNIQRGDFWDAETKNFYKWHQIEELKKIREVRNDTVSK